MGKGDKRSKRGKISNGSYGKTRPKKKVAAKPVVEEKAGKKGK
jgi:30S ribosomal protein S31